MKAKIDKLRTESVLSDEELMDFETSLDTMEVDADNLEKIVKEKRNDGGRGRPVPSSRRRPPKRSSFEDLCESFSRRIGRQLLAWGAGSDEDTLVLEIQGGRDNSYPLSLIFDVAIKNVHLFVRLGASKLLTQLNERGVLSKELSVR
ncbi:hypothetical protein TNCV_3578911 [Trichonephila clavipes]|nr:hypothetical protein TNCV_3578911 [Trichonephila clavipes]